MTVDQLYAQVDKKEKRKEDIDPLEDGPTAGNAEADKSEKKEAEPEEVVEVAVREDAAQDLGAVYAVVDKSKAPQIPSKSDSLMEDLVVTPPQVPSRTGFLLNELQGIDNL